MNNKNLAIILVVVAIIAVGVGGYIMFVPKTFQSDVKCLGCKETVKADVTAKCVYPIACPKCKKVEAYPATLYQCSNPQCEYAKKPASLAEKELIVAKDAAKDGNCPKCKTGTLTPVAAEAPAAAPAAKPQ